MEYFAHSGEESTMMHGFEDGMEYGTWGLVWMVLLVILVIAVVAWLVRASGNGSSSTKEQAPLDILKNRYAKGEITKQQFDEAKKDLTTK